MYKDKEKQREAVKKAVKKHRQGITEGITVKVAHTDGKTARPIMDIIDKLTDPFWRGRLEKICLSFKHSQYSKDVWLGDTNLSTACDWLECTA